MDGDCNETGRQQQCRKSADSIRRLSAEGNSKDHGSKTPRTKGAGKPKKNTAVATAKRTVSEDATLSGANGSERGGSAAEKLSITASAAVPAASAGKKKRVSSRANVERRAERDESSSKAGRSSKSTSVDAELQPSSDARPQNQTADNGRSAARQRAAEKRDAIRRNHLERRSRKQAATRPASIAATVLYRPADRTASFRLLPRRTIVEALGEIRGVAAVRVNFQRNVVAVDVAERSVVETLLAMDSVSGLRVVGRELAARPGTSSGVIYSDLEGNLERDAAGCAEVYLSDVPVASARPSRSGRSVLLRFDAAVHPPYVYVCWQRLTVRPNRPRPLQCRNCGRFNHAAASCQLPERCMRCGQSGGHSQGPCEAAAKCGNCNGPHAMTDYRCRIWKQERRVEAALATADVTSRREARATVRAACRDLESRRAKKRRSAKQAQSLKKECPLQPEQVQVASQPSVGRMNKKAVASQVQLPNALAQRAKAAISQGKALILPGKSNGAGDAGPRGKRSGGAPPLGNGALSGTTGHTRSMSTKLPPARQRSTSAEWASTPQGIACPLTNQAYPSGHAAATGRTHLVTSLSSGAKDRPAKTKGAASKTAVAASQHTDSTASAAASGVSSRATGTSTDAKAPPRDQEEAYYSVLAQLATALQGYYSQIAPPVAEGNVKKKKSGGKKRW